MVFDKSKNVIFEITKIWQRSNLIEGTTAYFKSIEGEELKALEKEISNLELKIDKFNAELEILKEKSKSDKSKKKAFDKKKDQIKDFANKLKNKKKSVPRINQSLKERTNKFLEKTKMLSKIFSEISKFQVNVVKNKDTMKNIVRYETLFNIFHDTNEIFPFTKMVNYCNLELKVENEAGSRKLQKLNTFLIYIMESIACNLLESGIKEKLINPKLMQLKHSCRLLMSVVNLARKENFNITYYEALTNYFNFKYSFYLGQKEMENHNYHKATQYLIKSKEYLEKCSKNLPINEKQLNKDLYLVSAFASDSFNLIYLLNSFANWRGVLENIPGDMKEIAEISYKNVESWITKQYGFPDEDKLVEILNDIEWPKPITPKEIKNLKGILEDKSDVS